MGMAGIRKDNTVTNRDKANRGGKDNQTQRIEHQLRQVERRERRKLRISNQPTTKLGGPRERVGA